MILYANYIVYGRNRQVRYKQIVQVIKYTEENIHLDWLEVAEAFDCFEHCKLIITIKIVTVSFFWVFDSH